MGTQLMLSFAKRYFLNLSNALNPKPNSQTIRALSPYRNISLFSFVFILKYTHLFLLIDIPYQQPSALFLLPGKIVPYNILLGIHGFLH